MDREKRIGIMLILVGFLIPLAALPFVSGFSKDKGFYENFNNVGIPIGKDSKDNVPSQPAIKGEGDNAKLKITWSMLIPQRIPLRFFFVPTVMLIYMGIIRIDRARKRRLKG
jgi:hypothetical protein